MKSMGVGTGGVHVYVPPFDWRAGLLLGLLVVGCGIVAFEAFPKNYSDAVREYEAARSAFSKGGGCYSQVRVMYDGLEETCRAKGRWLVSYLWFSAAVQTMRDMRPGPPEWKTVGLLAALGFLLAALAGVLYCSGLVNNFHGKSTDLGAVKRHAA